MHTVYGALIMGASYGSLLAAKLLLEGHSVELACLPAEAELINAEGIRVRLPVGGRDELVEIDSRKLPGKLSAGTPQTIDPGKFDLVALAMQEPQYRSPGVRELGRRGQGPRALHLDHEHAAAPVSQAHSRTRCGRVPTRLYGSDRLGQLRSRADDAVQPRS
jgi:hypothetical protein